MRSQYIDIMEKVLEAYSTQDIQDYVADVRQNGLKEHGFPRLTANIGILIAHNKRHDLKELFLEMMDLCCDQMPDILKLRTMVGNNFSVKEIVFCMLELEKAKVFEKEKTESWRQMLSVLDPYMTYDMLAKHPEDPVHNWAAYAAASEQLRKMASIGDESTFIETQLLSQLMPFDENGMYRDPNEPITYDIVTRLQLAVLLFCGYDGKGKEELEQALLKSAKPTLLMQSVTGEIPFGGRTNQFLHNDSSLVALCEFYASLYKQKGDLALAGQFKRAARLATEALIPWLSADDTIYHIKNYFDRDTKFGCETYAYFNKYMVTTASWLYLAYYFADDTIEERPCPSEGNCCWQTSKYFHQTFLNFANYFVQVDTKANYEYDASGIGRIQFRGAPVAICCSVPFAKEPHYTMDIANPSSLAIGGGVETVDGWHYTWEEGTAYRITELQFDDKCGRICMECVLPNQETLTQTVVVTEKGVSITAKGNGAVALTLPVFAFDGKTKTSICAGEQSVSTSYQNWRCSFTTDGAMKDANLLYGNRNGHYQRFDACGTNEVTVQIVIEKE